MSLTGSTTTSSVQSMDPPSVVVVSPRFAIIYIGGSRRTADRPLPDPLRRRRRDPRPDPGAGDRRDRAPDPGARRAGGSRLRLLPDVRRDFNRRAGRAQPDRAGSPAAGAAGG